MCVCNWPEDVVVRSAHISYLRVHFRLEYEKKANEIKGFSRHWDKKIVDVIRQIDKQ